MTTSKPQCGCPVSRHPGHQIYHGADCWVTSLVGAHAEIERLTRERDEWAEKCQRWRAKYAELRYPGMSAAVHVMDVLADEERSDST